MLNSIPLQKHQKFNLFLGLEHRIIRKIAQIKRVNTSSYSPGIPSVTTSAHLELSSTAISPFKLKQNQSLGYYIMEDEGISIVWPPGDRCEH